MGEVCKSRDTRLDRFVAVKVIAADLSASSEQRSASSTKRTRSPGDPGLDLDHSKVVDQKDPP